MCCKGESVLETLDFDVTIQTPHPRGGKTNGRQKKRKEEEQEDEDDRRDEDDKGMKRGGDAKDDGEDDDATRGAKKRRVDEAIRAVKVLIEKGWLQAAC